MRIGGWLRLWIVITVLYGCGVAVIAYGERPTLEQLQYNWVRDAADIVATKISDAQGKKVAGYEIRDQWVATKNDAAVIELLEKIESAHNEKQGLFSSDVAKINAKHRQIVSQLESQRVSHFLLSLTWWLGPSLLVLTLGLSVGWVIGVGPFPWTVLRLGHKRLSTGPCAGA